MIDMSKFIKSLKSTWIRHLWMYSDAPWVHLINYKLNNTLLIISSISQIPFGRTF